MVRFFIVYDILNVLLNNSYAWPVAKIIGGFSKMKAVVPFSVRFLDCALHYDYFVKKVLHFIDINRS